MGDSQEISDTELSGQFEKSTVTGEEGENEQMQKLRWVLVSKENLVKKLLFQTKILDYAHFGTLIKLSKLFDISVVWTSKFHIKNLLFQENFMKGSRIVLLIVWCFKPIANQEITVSSSLNKPESLENHDVTYFSRYWDV